MSSGRSAIRNFNLRVPVLASAANLIHHYPCDEGSDSTLTDVINGSNGTLNGDTAWVAGYFNNAPNYGLFFDGANDSVNATLDPTLTGDFTVMFWFKASNQGAQNMVLELAQAAAVGLQVCLSATGQVIIENAGGPTSLITSGALYGGNVWHMGAVTRFSTTYTLYINGVSIGTSGGTAPTYTRLFLGERSDGLQDFTGSVTSISIFDAVLDGTAILAYYAQGKTLASGNISTSGVEQLIERIVVPTGLLFQDFQTVLDGDVDGAYKIKIYHVAGATGNPALELRINGAATVSSRSFVRQTFTSTVSGGYGASQTFEQIQSSGGTAITSMSELLLLNPISSSTKVRTFLVHSSHFGNDTNLVGQAVTVFALSTPATTVKIIRLGVADEAAGGLAAGSILELYKTKF